MSDENRELNIAIPLSRDVTKMVLEMNRRLSELGKLAYLFGEKATPHITLYSVKYPEENESKVSEKFRSWACQLPRFEIDLTHLEVDRVGSVYAEIEVEKNELIEILHYEIMDNFGPFREGHVRSKYKDPEFLATLPLGEMESIKAWGRPSVGEFFSPHISIGRVVDGGKIPEDYLSWKRQLMIVDELIVGRGGEWGTIVEILERVELGK